MPTKFYFDIQCKSCTTSFKFYLATYILQVFTSTFIVVALGFY